jgi:hypothetical protein
MIILFFKDNFDFAKQYVHKHSYCVAFWYSKGLSSYQLLNEVINIEKLIIEESIAEALLLQYASVFGSVPYEIFENNSQKSISPSLSLSSCSFLASNDTIAYLFKNVVGKMEGEYNFYCKPGENAQQAASKLGIYSKGTSTECAKNFSATSLLILGNDWGLEERNLNNFFIRRKINTVCLQESSIDLNPKDGRMRNCSFPVFQGVNSLKNIDVNKMICAVIGNPRFEELQVSPPPHKKNVFINVNFTYGMFEDKREDWVNDVLGICSMLQVDYIISQHPRDNGKFENFNLLKSNAGLVHQTIKESSVVVSRFSALLLEAICMGRPAVYYNPHGEDMFYKFDPDNHSLFYADSFDSLQGILQKVLSDQYTFSSGSTLSLHLGNTAEGKASHYIVRLLESIKGQNVLKSISTKESLVVKLRILKKTMVGWLKKLI